MKHASAYDYHCHMCGNDFTTDEFPDEYPRKYMECPRCGMMGVHEESAPNVIGTSSTGWPMVSECAGVSPEQVPAMKKKLLESGVSCNFDGEGRPEFISPSHRKKCLKAMGLIDKGSFN